MKPGLRCLPNEVWVDVFIFPWISRKQLGKIVHKLGNTTIVEVLQYILHERGNRTLGKIRLDKELSIPQTPMPENIKYFECIEICHLDSSTLDFLRQLSPLFTCVNLFFDDFFERIDDFTNLRAILGHLTPLLHGIHSMSFDQNAIPTVQQFIGPKLAQVKMLQIDGWHRQLDINFYMDWLNSEERDFTEPRYLVVSTFTDLSEHFSMALRQQFQSAKKRCTFAIKVLYPNEDELADFHLENSLGEELHGQTDGVGLGRFQITRHQPNAGPALREWIVETKAKRFNEEKWSYLSEVVIKRDVTIGQIDANAGANGVNVVEEEADHPSTSKSFNENATIGPIHDVHDTGCFGQLLWLLGLRR